MLEKVAKAIYGTVFANDEAWDKLDRAPRERFIELARAAVEALREPSEGMQKAVRPQEYTVEHYYGTGHHRSFPHLGAGPIQVWQDMIDAILSEQEKPE
jgi:hypothetical protein